MTGHFEYPGPDDEFVLMQRAAEAVDEAFADLSAELIYETQAAHEAAHALGVTATNQAVEEMLASIEDDVALAHDQAGFADSVEADLASGVIADQAAVYLRGRTPSTGVTMVKAGDSGTTEPDMAYRIALDVRRGLLAPLALNTPRPVSLVKRPRQ